MRQRPDLQGRLLRLLLSSEYVALACRRLIGAVRKVRDRSSRQAFAHPVRARAGDRIGTAGATAHVVAGDAALLPGGVAVAVGAALAVVIGVVFTDDLASSFAPASPPARS
ncbi:hypothetical protein [Nonomuraea cavernae]|uniref:hypothetical protein n=1 Tax=Nonomuraea cavernae TaxID=2045107 RepID=UPI00166403F2|nr:hypothetical protein [Nonomuraea cavernae]MCA2189915.1 hypothetical protein [Nonomuraea cavernae]